MSENFEIDNEENRLSDVIFALLPENNIITNRAFLYAFNGNFLKASMLSRYTHCFIKNDCQEITYKDRTFEEQYYCPEISVKRAKKELKDDGFITVVQKGIPAVGYITVNIEKVAGILGNFKKYQFDTSGDVNLIPLYNIDNKIKNNRINIENTKRKIEEVFEDRFWVLVPNKVGKEKAKKLFFRITNNCKSEEKVNEVVEGYKRYLSFLAKNKDNNFNRRPKDPSTFLNVENKLWLEPWEFNEEEVAVSAGGSRIKQPKNWQDRIGIAKNLGLLDDFEPEEIREMYKAWKYIPREAKEAIVSEEVDNRIKQIEEYRKAEKERQQKEAAEQKRQKIDRLVRDYEEEYQSLKDVLSFDYENLEDALKHGENILYGVIEKILEHEKQLERKAAEQKRQEEEAKAREEEAKRNREREIRAEKFRKAYRAMFDWVESNCDLTEFVKEHADKIEKLKSFFDEELSLSEMLSCQNTEDKFLNVVVFLRMKLDDFINQGAYKDAYKVQKNIFRKAIA